MNYDITERFWTTKFLRKTLKVCPFPSRVAVCLVGTCRRGGWVGLHLVGSRRSFVLLQKFLSLHAFKGGDGLQSNPGTVEHVAPDDIPGAGGDKRLGNLVVLIHTRIAHCGRRLGEGTGPEEETHMAMNQPLVYGQWEPLSELLSFFVKHTVRTWTVQPRWH